MNWETAAAAFVLIVGAIVAGIAGLRKSKAEADRDAVAIYREMVTTLQEAHDVQVKENQKLRFECEEEFRAVRRECEAEVRQLRTELSAIRTQIALRDTKDIKEHEKMPGPNTLADIIVDKVVEAIKDQPNG